MLRGLADDLRTGEQGSPAAERSAAVHSKLAEALGQSLDELRLAAASDFRVAEALELSAALAAVALLGAAACSRRGDAPAAMLLLDSALLRSRSERHSDLLRCAASTIDSAYSVVDAEHDANATDAATSKALEATSSTDSPAAPQKRQRRQR